MRIAVLIIGLILMLGVGIQSCTVAVGGEVVSGLSETEAEKQQGEDLSAGGAAGMLVALLFLIASALVIAKPKASMWIFVAAGLVALLGATTGFSDLVLWGIAAFVLAGMSYLGVKEVRKKAHRRDEELRLAYAQGAAAAATAPPPPPAGHVESQVPPPQPPRSEANDAGRTSGASLTDRLRDYGSGTERGGDAPRD